MTPEQTAGDVFRKYYTELCRYVQQRFSQAGEADDIVQDAFQNVLHTGDFDLIANPRAYLYKTAKNIALNHLRRKDCQDGIFVELDEIEPMSIPMERQIMAENDIKHLKHVLQRMSEKDRTTFLMNRIDGKTYKEISLELGITVSSVEKRMMKVLTVIRQALDER